jgi:hypothetical protein
MACPDFGATHPHPQLSQRVFQVIGRQARSAGMRGASLCSRRSRHLFGSGAAAQTRCTSSTGYGPISHGNASHGSAWRYPPHHSSALPRCWLRRAFSMRRRRRRSFPRLDRGCERKSRLVDGDGGFVAGYRSVCYRLGGAAHAQCAGGSVLGRSGCATSSRLCTWERRPSRPSSEYSPFRLRIGSPSWLSEPTSAPLLAANVRAAKA